MFDSTLSKGRTIPELANGTATTTGAERQVRSLNETRRILCNIMSIWITHSGNIFGSNEKCHPDI